MSDIDTSGGVFMVGTSGSQENGDDYLGLLSALLRRGIAESAIFSDFDLLMIGRNWSKADAHE
ncbi:hypothetical protein SB759_24760 [Pseudomonas sp. SIMBA_059]